MNLDDVAQDLYGLPPEEFTAVRTARAKEISATGNRELAAEVRKLPKPTMAAWLANTLVRTRAPEVEDLIALGPKLREALSGGARADMRRIVDRRREAIQQLVAAAVQSAAQAGRSMGSQVQRQVEETLEAAVADDESASMLRVGRLSSPLAYIGFGGVDAITEGSRAQSKRARSKRASSGDVGSDEKRQATERALTKAAEVLSSAQRAMESSNVLVDDARRRHNDASARQRAATKELRDADRERERAEKDLESALRVRAAAKQHLKDAQVGCKNR